ncbi:MAG: D-sedoheptulose 7-phosphate isomerase [Bacteroidetes bacterium]|jgi:D-sedoheptulose 7-phosphate isomerase|nr:D-sedoheptulose 7-phosphate isomerase [Bacteroidota bacterium]
MSRIKDQFMEAAQVLHEFITNDNNFKTIQQAGEVMVEAIQKGNKIISCGNGGSMTDAMHFAEELTGRFREHRPSMPAISISDPSHITCAANDYGFEHIFSRFVEGMGNQHDVLLAISTSGNSPNIVNAVEAAQQRGLKVVALTGKSGGELAQLADVEIRVPHNGYSDRIQEIHIKIIHTLITYIEANIAG